MELTLIVDDAVLDVTNFLLLYLNLHSFTGNFITQMEDIFAL